MKVLYKFVAITLFFAFGQDSIFGQSNSEIVMTKSELESFLSNIANRKREQMSKRRQSLLISDQLEVHEKAPVNVDDRLYREFDRINSRIDLLMLNSGNSVNYSGYRQPGLILQQERGISAYPNSLVVPNNYDLNSNLPAPGNFRENENRQLENQIRALNEEIRVLTQLKSNAKINDYDDEILSLSAKVEGLKEEIEKKNSNKIIEKTVVRDSSNLPKGLEDYNKKIYFANNSSVLSKSDKLALSQLAEMVKTNAPRVTVVIRGFASRSGSAQYNNNLSFNRAEAVKEMLLNYGLNARDILTLHHGIDNSTSSEQARRVEINLLVQ